MREHSGWLGTKVDVTHENKSNRTHSKVAGVTPMLITKLYLCQTQSQPSWHATVDEAPPLSVLPCDALHCKQFPRLTLGRPSLLALRMGEGVKRVFPTWRETEDPPEGFAFRVLSVNPAILKSQNQIPLSLAERV